MSTPATQERERLLHANLERIEYLYEQSVRDGIKQPVILLLDIRDPRARILAEAVTSKEEVAKQADLAMEKKVDFSLLLALSQEQAISVFSHASPNAKTLLASQLPPGVFVVVVHAANGVLWVTRSIPDSA